ncbi:MAG: hypothetical protein HFG27_11510 [Provencibacterium sp.]|nr:hypothetical protein [Provencibacterium sp.]
MAPIDGEEWDDTAVYTVDYSADKLTDFPFQMKFRAETLGKFEFGSYFYYDGTYGMGESRIYTITGPSNIVPPADINDAIENPTGSGIVIDVPQNMGLNKDSFESIWEKANGQPVTLNANGAKLTFDTAEPLSAEFLRDLQNRNDNFFNPAVYSRIPQKAQEAGYHGGRWMEFMYSGVLPGKMSVTVDVPQNTFPTGTALRLWYYDTLTGRASLDPATVTFNGNRATFSITHCSTYALYLAGYDPNPGSTQKPDDKPDPKPEGKPDPKPDNKPGSGSSSGSGSGSTEKTFGWADMREEIRAAKAGDTLRFTVSADEKVPASLLRALKSKEDVALILRYGNSKSVTISSDAIGSIEKAEYRFNELQQLFASQNEERESAETVPSDKKNPGTGAPEKTGLSLLAFLPLGALLLKKHSR